jgi:hypothetical protein
MNPVFDIFNDIVSGMVREENGEEYVANFLNIKGASGEPHTLTIDQLELLVGVLKGNHSFLKDYNPLEFLLFSYQFQDKIKKDWLAKEYQIMYDNVENTLYVNGIVIHPITAEGHASYVADANIPPEKFSTVIPNIGLYGVLALINCIAAQAPEFEKVRGAWGSSFVYEFKDGKISIRDYDPVKEAEAMLPDTATVDGAIEKAVENIRKEITE